MSVTNKPQIEAFIGASGSGKGVSINRRLDALRPARLVIWDPRDEYGRHAAPVHTLSALLQAIGKAGKAGPLRVRYVPGGSLDLGKSFAIVCKAVFAAGALVFVAEELSDVTTPSWAPPAWRQISTQGRHRGLHVLGAAQRPTMIDKAFLGNCTHVRCFQLGYDSDIKAMSKELRAPESMVAGLVTEDTPGGADIRFLQYERRTRALIAGRITIKAGRVTERQAPADGSAAEPRKARRPVAAT